MAWKILATVSFVFSVEAFVTSISPLKPTLCSSLETASWAKSSPKLNFDLEAIESFESQLDQMDLEMNESDGEDDEDDLEVSNETKFITIPIDLNNKRIDAALAALLEPDVSRSVCGNLVSGGRVELISSSDISESEDRNKHAMGEVIDRKSFKVESGMTIKVSIPADEVPKEIIAQNLPLDVLYEDEHMIVLNKAAHMVVHPAAGNWDGTVVNALAHYLPQSAYGRGDFLDQDGKVINPNDCTSGSEVKEDALKEEANTVSFRPGIVHRLDKGTTGVLVVAKTTRALTALAEAFAQRRVSKTYLAITVGNPGRNVKIDKPIGRHPIHRQRMRVVPDPHQKNSRNRLGPNRRLLVDNRPPSQVGRRALSYVDTLAFDSRLGLVRVKIETGRTHQIRVHLQDRHTPIYGDDVYGLADWNKRLSASHQIKRPLLHAYKLALDHPITGEAMEFTAPLDADMMRIAHFIVPPGSEQELTELLNWK